MKTFAKFLTVLLCTMTATALSARQSPEAEQKQSAIEQLRKITLASSEGDSVNIGNEVTKNAFTLIVMYRGVW